MLEHRLGSTFLYIYNSGLALGSETTPRLPVCWAFKTSSIALISSSSSFSSMFSSFNLVFAAVRTEFSAAKADTSKVGCCRVCGWPWRPACCRRASRAWFWRRKTLIRELDSGSSNYICSTLHAPPDQPASFRSFRVASASDDTDYAFVGFHPLVR